MKKQLFFAAAGGLLAAASPALAQNPAASQQADAMRFRETLQSPMVSSNAAPEFYNGETSDVGPQTLLEMKNRRHYIRAFADEQLFYTDNMFLADKGTVGADVLVSTLQVALAPDSYDFMGGQFSPEVGYQQQWFSYGLLNNEKLQVVRFINGQPHISFPRIGVFDFNVQTVFGGGSWRWHHWDFSAGTDFRRFLDSGNYNVFYTELVPRWGANYTFDLGENKSVTVGYEGDYRFTTTLNAFPANPDDYNDRTDQSLVLMGSWQLCAHAIVQPYYRLQYSYFPHVISGRTDWLNSLGVALQLPFTQNIALRTYISYDTLRTDGIYVKSYDKFDVGAGVNLSVRF